MTTRTFARFASVTAIALASVLSTTGCGEDGFSSTVDPSAAVRDEVRMASSGATVTDTELAQKVMMADCLGYRVPDSIREALNGGTPDVERIHQWTTRFDSYVAYNVGLEDQVRLYAFAAGDAPPPLAHLDVQSTVSLVEYGRSRAWGRFAGLPAAPLLASYANETAFTQDWIDWRDAAQELIDGLHRRTQKRMRTFYLEDIIQA